MAEPDTAATVCKEGIGEPVRIPEELLIPGWWYLGELWYKLYGSQLTVYQALEEWKSAHPDLAGPAVLNMHRAWGKTFFLVLMAIARCVKYPWQEVRYAAPGLGQCVDFVFPNLFKILTDCPRDLQPEKKEWTWTFRNPRWGDSDAYSKLFLIGCREHGNAHRGKRSDMIIIDECRDILNFEYVSTDVFGFHFATRDNPLMIMSSTPPKSPGHPFTNRYIPQAMADGRYFCCPTTENPDWRQQDDRMLEAICGGKDTVSWKREALCELVADDSSLIVPEYREHRDDIFVETYERPPYFFPRVSIDVGFTDFTGLLFGYIDWLRQRLVLEAEVCSPYLSDQDIVKLGRQKEDELWGGETPVHHFASLRRFGDATQHTLLTLRKDYGYTVKAAEKWDRDAAIINLRSKIQNGRLVILKKGCPVLDSQLRNCCWNERRTDFDRSAEHGHFDLGMALVYFNRMAEWRLNPYPGKTWDLTDMALKSGANVLHQDMEVTKSPVQVTHHSSVTRNGIPVIRKRWQPPAE